ncbi:NEDD8-activating enzyme E1 catalytic subunit [Trachymyrmex zeteki]|uniref:NEDD8-activating enzyme E1 catalytic subunit n=1 Tax=Mycetomoellerius zeteki TaxID=64791 RepID=A0A151WTU5_9HYME|nr:PREDICTED: NEDD8-activating enzyme E1 catalytic subunit [Trachymyrmex zeteki]KYQ51264.1 NEDD8-activating enzyme E1 catalytic subunit [Trachymyrmex zeteki]
MSFDHMQRRWSNLRKVLERSGPFCRPDFEPSPENLQMLVDHCRILVVGAGGLGCELLKNLALMGFRHLHVIDMDTIELSNLNRQFLFRHKDIGFYKAEVAARFINTRVPGCNVVPHNCEIQTKSEAFFQEFHMVICGLDSIVARRWLNGMLMSLLVYENGELDQASVIPMIDGGTEGFKGNVRVILPGMSPCIECTLDFYPPQVTYPLCTIANTPRLPEHCIEYVKVIQWPKENPFDCAIDGDDPQHINWIYEKSNDRAAQFGIQGLTYRLVQGVVKNIIPAVASTNAVIAAACATEAFKLATSCSASLNNYMVLNDLDGVYTYTFEVERKINCLACSQVPREIEIKDSKYKLQNLIDLLCERPDLQMKSPAITAVIDGKCKTLYMQMVASIEEKTRENLSKTLIELGLKDGTEINVADVTTPSTITLKLKFPQDNSASQ